MTTPTQTMAAYRPVRASRAAAWGSSNEPGTQCDLDRLVGTPAEDRAAIAPDEQSLADALVEAGRDDGEPSTIEAGAITPVETRGAAGHRQSGSEVNR